MISAGRLIAAPERIYACGLRRSCRLITSDSESRDRHIAAAQAIAESLADDEQRILQADLDSLR
jgi:hypothetical protein